jgi:hypothetical protein
MHINKDILIACIFDSYLLLGAAAMVRVCTH